MPESMSVQETMRVNSKLENIEVVVSLAPEDQKEAIVAANRSYQKLEEWISSLVQMAVQP